MYYERDGAGYKPVPHWQRRERAIMAERRETARNQSLQALGISASFDSVITNPQLATHALTIATERLLGAYGHIDDDSKNAFTANAQRIQQALFSPSAIKLEDGTIIPPEEVQRQARMQAEQMISTASLLSGGDIVVFPTKPKKLEKA